MEEDGLPAVNMDCCWGCPPPNSNIGLGEATVGAELPNIVVPCKDNGVAVLAKLILGVVWLKLNPVTLVVVGGRV